MFRSYETFNTIFELNGSTFVHEIYNCSFVNRTYGEHCLKHIPRIVFKLLVSKAKTTIFCIYFKNNNIYVRTNLSKL